MSGLDSLLVLKSKIPLEQSTQALRSQVQLFVRNISALIEEHGVFSDEKLALQMLNIVKDFWSLLSNQHAMLTRQVYGRYSAPLYEVLPSLASVYIDLFIAVHSTKGIVDKAAKRLYSWLMFDLNERCIKTALLEAYGCTTAGARLVLPLLRTVLSSSSVNTSKLDYLLHFILLKRWSFVCPDLGDLIQVSSSIQAPGGFLEWLEQHWPKAAEYLPIDKSLKGRRISEFLLDVDRQAVEELIDVFSEALSVEQTTEQDIDGVNKKSTDKAVTDQPYFIDTKGNEIDEMQQKTEQPILQNQKETGRKKDVDFSKSGRKNKRDSDIFILSDSDRKNNRDSDIFILSDSDRKNKRDSDIFILSGQMDETSFSKAHERGAGDEKDSFMNFSFEQSADEQTEHRIENVQPLKKKKLSTGKIEENIVWLSSDSDISETQEVPIETTDPKDANCTVEVKASKAGGKDSTVEFEIINVEDEPETMDHETNYTVESIGSNDSNSTVPESPVKPDITIIQTRSISVPKSAQGKISWTGKENECSSNADKSTTSLKKYKKNSDTDFTATVNKESQLSPRLTGGLHTVPSSVSLHSPFADKIKNKKQRASPEVKRMLTRTSVETESNEKELSGAAQPSENTEITKVKETTVDGSNTEYKVGLMLSKIRKSVSDVRKRQTDSCPVKTRLRTKSESMAQTDLHETRSRKPPVTATTDDFKGWLRQSPSRALKNQSSPKNLMPENKELTESPIKRAKVETTAAETKGPRNIFGTPLKTYSRKDKKVATRNIEARSTQESPLIKDKSPKKKIGSDNSSSPGLTPKQKSPKRTIAAHNTEVSSSPVLTAKHKSPNKKIGSDNTEVSSSPRLTTKHKSPKKSSGESERSRYFLRTNCSHRLLTEDNVCPSCSPTTKV